MIQIRGIKVFWTSGLFLITYLILISHIFQNCKDDPKTTIQPFDKDGFMGDLSCKSCHTKEYDEWYGSHHDMAMQIADTNTILGDFNDREITSNGVLTKFFRQGEKYMVNTEGPKGEYQDFEISYTFGVEPLQQYLIAFPGGRYQCLLIAWDTDKKEWYDLMPNEKTTSDDWLHWTKGSMTWNTMCADCHSTNLRKNYNEVSNSFNTQWSIIDVSCEACHGPGKEHYRYVNSSDFRMGRKTKGSYMFQVKGVDKKKQIDDCARCHSRRGQITEYYDYTGRFMDHYTPSLITPGLYHIDGQILDEVYVYGSFLQSKMYHNNVSCMDCHNPHSLEMKFQGNMLCTQCHVKETYESPAHHFHKPETDASQCINCHMPGKVYMGNDFRRDHGFRVPRPDLSITNGAPDACTGCHADKSLRWAADAIINWYGPDRAPHFSDLLTAIQAGDAGALPGLLAMVGDTSASEIIQASVLELIAGIGSPDANNVVLRSLNHYDPLVRYAAVNVMSSASLDVRLPYLTPLLSDSVRAVRTQTIYSLADAGEKMFTGQMLSKYLNAREEFETSMKMQADFPSGQLIKGQYYHKRQELDKAMEAYSRASSMDPYLPQPYYNKANIVYGRGLQDEAKELFLKAIALDSNYVNAHYAVGLLMAELNDYRKAELHLGKSAKLSGNPRYYYNWGLSLQNLNRREEAEQAFLKGIKIFPASEANWYALTILYLQDNELKKAKDCASKLIRLDPNNAEYQNLLRSAQ